MCYKSCIMAENRTDQVGGVLKTVGEELKKQLPQIVIRTIAILSIFLVSQNSVKDYNKEEFKIFMQIVWLVSMIEPLMRVGDQSILKGLDYLRV